MKLVLVLLLLSAVVSRGADALSTLIKILGESRDPQVQLDMLRGLQEASLGRGKIPMPEGWPVVEQALSSSSNPETRSRTLYLGLSFGSETARDALRGVLTDASRDPAQRQDALRALVGARDSSLPATLRGLLKDTALRGAALRALAAFEDAGSAKAILEIYRSLTGSDRREALTTLAARVQPARELLHAMESGTVPSKDLTAEVIRQLRSLKDEEVNAALTRVYGTVREVAADKQSEIERYKRLYWAGGSTPGDAISGRAVYARVCQQCHTLFDVGGRVGPDLTGSNRGDLDYIIQNIVDPNAVIPNEYLASTLELKDGRVLTGILKQQDDRSLTVATANETLTIPRAEVTEISQSQLSMMPEGLVAPLADQEFRDLVYYLGRTGQVPMLATAETSGLFFNSRDLTLWQGELEHWKVENGEIIGSSAGSQDEVLQLRSDMIVGDSRLIFRVKLSPDREGAGVFFRSEPSTDGKLHGYELLLGGRSWCKLVDKGGRGVIMDKSEMAPTRDDEWNLVEIIASGSRIRIAINARPCVEIDDPSGPRRGMIGFELHKAGAGELRIKDLKLELNPSASYSTVGH